MTSSPDAGVDRAPKEPRQRSPSPAHLRLAAGAMIVLAGVLYFKALQNPFVYDDYPMIVENESLVDVNVRGLFLRHVSRPVLNVSYAVDRALWGAGPRGFHLTNIALQMVNVGLLYALATALTRRHGSLAPSTGGRTGPRPHIVGLTAGALLSVHPMMTEAVGYISGRSEVLCATFFLLALLSVCRWMRGGHWTALVLTAGFWALALGTKEIAVMFPVVALACDRWVIRGDQRERRRRLMRLHLPALLAVACVVTLRLTVFAVFERNGAIQPDWYLLLVQLDMIRRYLSMLVLPADQLIFHAVAPIHSTFDPRAVLGAGTVGALLAVAWRLRSAHGTASVGLLWFLALLLPSSILFTLGRGEAIAEHRVYVASCGLFMSAGVLVDSLGRRLTRPAPRLLFRSAAASMLLLLSMRTILRNHVWGDPVALWTEAVLAAPHHWLPYVPLGEELHRSGRHEEAVTAFAQSVNLNPVELGAHAKLGVCLIETGRLDAAAGTFEELRRRKPDSAESAFGLGMVALARGREEEARTLFLEALARDPSNQAARRALTRLETETKSGASFSPR